MKIIDFVKRYGSVGLAQLIPLNTLMRPNGNIFFVDSSNANAADQNDGEQGNSWEKPFATITYAIEMDLVVASQGDVILVAPSHTETVTNSTLVTTAGSFIMDIAGVSIIGLGYGVLKPTITLTTAAAAGISITAPNCMIRNIRLVSAFTNGVTAGITLGALADGCVLDGIDLRETLSTQEFLIGIDIAAACNNVTIQNCTFLNASGSTTYGVAIGVTGTNVVDGLNLINNRFTGLFDTACIGGSTYKHTNMFISKNMVVNKKGTGAPCLLLAAECTGIIADNYLSGAGAETTVTSTLTANALIAFCGVFNNFCVGDDAKSGGITPAVATIN
jgi:hypothetical protein